MSLQTEIRKSFRLTAEDAELTRELESLCNIYDLTPTALNTKWEAFALSNQMDTSKLTASYVRILATQLKRDFERNLKARRTTKGRVITKRAAGGGGLSSGINFSDFGLDNGDDNQEDSVENFMTNMFSGNNRAQPKQVRVTPVAAATQISNTQGMSQTSSQFINRKSSHVIETQHNGHLPLTLETADEDMTDIDQEFTFTLDHTIEPYRYMHEKIREKAEGIDDRVDYLGGLIGQHHHIEAFGNPTKPSQESICAYGMICSDSTSGESIRLNDKSIRMMTSRDLGMGKFVTLDLSKIPSYSFFPGQVVGMRGINHNGISFQVEEILTPPLPEKHTLPPREEKTINMIVASGPYTLDDDLSYRPLEELLNMCSQQKPDVILLMGPFLSIHHPKVAHAELDSFPEQIVRDQVINNLERLLDSACLSTHVFIAPHANDITHHYNNLFPQPKFTAFSIKHDRIHLTSNPASIQMNGHTIKLANLDILFRLGKEEISKNPQQTDRFTRLTEHLLQQHTYYPLYPSALGDGIDADRMVDLQLHDAPDILILPSQFKHFAKTMNHDRTLIVNPGHLCKHQAGGTYARIILYPRESIQERNRVDLFKL